MTICSLIILYSWSVCPAAVPMVSVSERNDDSYHLSLQWMLCGRRRLFLWSRPHNFFVAFTIIIQPSTIHRLIVLDTTITASATWPNVHAIHHPSIHPGLFLHFFCLNSWPQSRGARTFNCRSSFVIIHILRTCGQPGNVVYLDRPGVNRSVYHLFVPGDDPPALLSVSARNLSYPLACSYTPRVPVQGINWLSG